MTRSYINNIHPNYHPKLYEVIPKFIIKALPLWDRVLSTVRFGEIPPRVNDWSNSDGYGFQSETNEPEPGDDEDDEDFENRLEIWREQRTIVPPEPKDFKTPKERLTAGKVDVWSHQASSDSRDPPDTHPKVNLRAQFGRLQIIVKLANIHLTPDNPWYPGGSWHVEGQGNEAM